MTTGVSTSQTTQVPAGSAQAGSAAPLDLPDAYKDIRADPDIQFDPIELKEFEPREPSWIEDILEGFFEWLGDLFGPIGQFLTANWTALKWVFLAALIAFVLYLLARLIGPLANRRSGETAADEIEAEPEWQPGREESLALLEDADRLAAQGRFDEAARLLLQRSVGQISDARPEWVDPSSTARELASLPRLSEAARNAFRIMSAAVERSLFALKTLSRDDWEVARAAYADFALARIDAGKPQDRSRDSLRRRLAR